MSKDPALLVYTKDFLEGTADLSAEEFGVYTRLIFHQHQRGVLPFNLKKLARLGGVSLSEFEEIWKEIESKFIVNDTLSDTLSERTIYNERCTIEIAKRSQNGVKKSILAVYGNWIKANKNVAKKDIERIKKTFSVSDFISITDEENRKERIINYLESLLKTKTANAKRTHIANEDGDGNAITNKDETVDVVKKQKIEFQKIVDIFNSVCHKLSTVEKLTPKRKTVIKARIEEYGLSGLGDVFQKVSQSSFLNGENDRGWKADFDWILKPSNFIKIKEGNYQSNGKSNNNTGQSHIERMQSTNELVDNYFAQGE